MKQSAIVNCFVDMSNNIGRKGINCSEQKEITNNMVKSFRARLGNNSRVNEATHYPVAFPIQNLLPNDETINALQTRQNLIQRFRKGRR